MNITIRKADDWVAVYKDGAKVYEGHSCPIDMGLEALGVPCTTVAFDEANEWGEPITSDGSDPFPERLS